ncbi:MAG: YjbQ family protein [Chloroflexi bacterium]|nr:YjbQ family protein [Chloroflexota bacterium]
MKFLSQTFNIRTEKGPQFIDITDRIEEAARESGVTNGFAVIFSMHTTAAIRINENEPALLADMERMLEQIAPCSAEYKHNEAVHAFSDNGERPNGHSHCQHLLLGASEAVPVVDGKLIVGQWQRIFLIELDHGRDREVVVQLMGE